MRRMTMRAVQALLAVGLCLALAACGHEDAPISAQDTTQPTTQAATAPETMPQETQTQPTEPVEEHFLLTFAGDCTLGANPVNWYAGLGFIKTIGDDYDFPFRNVRTYFEADDLTFVNLEGVLGEEGVAAEKRFVFRGPAAYTQILTGSSVEVVTLANNHSRDYGQKGYDSTQRLLEEAGVAYVEKNASRLYTTQSGLTVGFYGVNFTVEQDELVRQIQALRQQGAEVVVIAFHWGTEYDYFPDDGQQALAHAAIDAGANIVYGSHPHVLQPVEAYRDGVIFYSMGNFSFGGNTCPRDFDTVLIQQEIIRYGDGTVALGERTVVPTCISSAEGVNNYQPTPYEAGSEGYNRVMEKLGLA